MSRLGRAWRSLEPEQRLAAVAAGGLFLSMFLPWYSQTNTVVVSSSARATQTSLSAFKAFSFVEAAVLLVSAGVLAMLFARAEGGSFQLPGGDGLVTMIAGGWCALLIFYRLLDKPSLHGTARVTATVGVQWGIFVALLLALALAYAGHRMRATERPPPPLVRERRRPLREEAQPAPYGPADAAAPRRARPRAPVEDETAADTRETQPLAAPPPATAPAPATGPPPATAAARGRPRYPPAPSGQLSFDEEPPAGE